MSCDHEIHNMYASCVHEVPALPPLDLHINDRSCPLLTFCGEASTGRQKHGDAAATPAPSHAVSRDRTTSHAARLTLQFVVVSRLGKLQISFMFLSFFFIVYVCICSDSYSYIYYCYYYYHYVIIFMIVNTI